MNTLNMSPVLIRMLEVPEDEVIVGQLDQSVKISSRDHFHNVPWSRPVFDVLAFVGRHAAEVGFGEGGAEGVDD